MGLRNLIRMINDYESTCRASAGRYALEALVGPEKDKISNENHAREENAKASAFEIMARKADWELSHPDE